MWCSLLAFRLFYESLLGLLSAHFSGQWWSPLVYQDAPLGFYRFFLTAGAPASQLFPLDSPVLS
jgi:hypothetical protein